MIENNDRDFKCELISACILRKLGRENHTICAVSPAKIHFNVFPPPILQMSSKDAYEKSWHSSTYALRLSKCLVIHKWAQGESNL